MRKKFNLKDFQINKTTTTTTSNNNPLLTLSILIVIMSLANYITHQIQTWKAPVVNWNETGNSINQLYITEPNTQNCNEGSLNDSEGQKVLNRLNYIRSLHNLNPVIYNYRDDLSTAKAALITAANLDKFEPPNPSFRCWSEQGMLGGNNSLSYAIIYPPGNTQIHATMNLYKSENFVDALLMDSRRENSAGSSWLLNPFLKSISFGRVDGKSLATKATIPGYNGEPVKREADYVSGAAIKFIFDENQDISDLNGDAIVYPHGEYPKELFKKDAYQRGYPPMSFSVIADNQKFVNNQRVDFSNTVIEIYKTNGERLEVNSIQYKKAPKGLPNVVSWKADEIETGVKYTVKIKNVKVFDTINDYEYWFKLR